jgi:hypothetical protein
LCSAYDDSQKRSDKRSGTITEEFFIKFGGATCPYAALKRNRFEKGLNGYIEWASPAECSEENYPVSHMNRGALNKLPNGNKTVAFKYHLC